MDASTALPVILVVDDDPDTATMFREALRDRGFGAELATSADDCLAYARAHRIDVVVTDFQMPGMNGIELCAKLHEIDPDLPVLVITGVGGLDAAIAAI